MAVVGETDTGLGPGNGMAKPEFLVPMLFEAMTQSALEWRLVFPVR
jgi:hypothetical protein